MLAQSLAVASPSILPSAAFAQAAAPAEVQPGPGAVPASPGTPSPPPGYLPLLGLQDNAGKTSTGIAGSLWGGYDFWVASQWSLGAEARVAALSARRNFSDYNGTMRDEAVSIELLFTALFH
jgi:hypothetical protein